MGQAVCEGIHIRLERRWKMGTQSVLLFEGKESTSVVVIVNRLALCPGILGPDRIEKQARACRWLH